MRPEKWKRVPSVDGLMASTLGNLRVDTYSAEMPHGGSRFYGGQVTRGQWDGARFVYRLRGRTYKVARLVCEAFHGLSAPAAPYCLHRDEDSRNNKPSNLKWGTQKENLNAPGFLSYCRGRTGENNPAVKGRQCRK